MQVIDKDPSKTFGEFTDVSRVEKYEISTEEYSKKTGGWARVKLVFADGLHFIKKCSMLAQLLIYQSWTLYWEDQATLLWTF